MPPSFERTIGEVIRKVRKRRGMTQRELGDAAGLDRSTLIRAENGTSLRSTTLEKIAKGLGVPVDTLLAALLPRIDGATAEIVGLVSGMTPQGKKKLLERLRRDLPAASERLAVGPVRASAPGRVTTGTRRTDAPPSRARR